MKLGLVPTDLEVADIFTKAVAAATFIKMRDYIYGPTSVSVEAMKKATAIARKLQSVLSMFDYGRWAEVMRAGGKRRWVRVWELSGAAAWRER